MWFVVAAIIKLIYFHQIHHFFQQIQTPRRVHFEMWIMGLLEFWWLISAPETPKKWRWHFHSPQFTGGTTNKCHPGLDLQNGWPFHSTDVVHTGSQGLDDVKNITSDTSILWMQKTLLDPSILLFHWQVGPWKCTQGASYPWNAASHKWQVETGWKIFALFFPSDGWTLLQMQNQSSSPCISVLRRRISRDKTPLTQHRWLCLHHASRLFEPREKTHHACPHLPEKRIRCRLACHPGHFLWPCLDVESLPVLLERKHRRDEMRGGKKLEKCNQRDFTFCQVGNLKVHQK